MNRLSVSRWHIFRRFVMAQSGIACLACLIVVFMVSRGFSAWVSGVAGVAAGLIAGAITAWFWSETLTRQSQQLAQQIESNFHLPASASIPGYERRVEPRTESRPVPRLENGSLFSGVEDAWENAAQNFRSAWSERHAAAHRNYTALTDLMRMVATAVDERISYLRGHSDRVAASSALIAAEMGIAAEQVERIRLSGLLHDIGTVGIEDYIVMKETPLSPEEFEIVKAHTVKGAAILRPIEALQDLIPGVELHHESLDGTGYPYGLSGEEIPLMARIVAVADAFDAMTTPRPYQQAMNPAYVLEVLGRLAGKRYDAEVVSALEALFHRGDIEVKNSRPPVLFRMRRTLAETGD